MTIHNEQLFSYAYLEQLLADASSDGLAQALARQIAEWAPTWNLSTADGALTTAVLPALDALGFSYGADPDAGLIHILYSDRSHATPLGTLCAAPPDADLDETRQGRHWMFLAVRAARKHHKRWALLTNGLHWRLLDATHLTPYEVYLDLDLSSLRERRPPDAALARALWAFLRRDAWLPDGQGKSALDGLDAASLQVSERAEGHLKEHLESVLGSLCRGFIDGDGRHTYTEEDRRAIFESATIAIYRMLFALYAEARGLLPTDHPAYAEHSMRALVQRAVAFQQGLANCSGATLWQGLKRLWGWIDGGNAEIGVDAYNGGLFSNERDDELSHDLSALRTQSISDLHLSRALVDLATIPNGAGSDGRARQLIDYRDLAVRHLGTLYEGILEHKLYVVEEPMLARSTDKGIRYLRAKGETQKRLDRLLEVGEIYFAQAPDERKATGSYYTPEYIVAYIVQHTAKLGLEERWQAFAVGLEGLSPEEQGQTLRAFVESQVLTYRVCDPAMGSGHFLVNAAQTITSFIVETLGQHGTGHAELDCDPAYWRRRVVGACLYGVDLNPLAVELAKLSLWLTTVERGRPLSFLDHHLRCGNSLIGARLEDLPVAGFGPDKRMPGTQQAPEGQLSFLDLPGVRESMGRAASGALALEAEPEETPDDVHAKSAHYGALRKELRRRYGLIADLAVARHLGLALDDDTFRRLVRSYLDGDQAYVPHFAADTVQRAGAIAQDHRFFHWQLEFPQVLYAAPNGAMGAERGFQAVIGNPPYVRQETLGDIKALFMQQYAVYSGSSDLYAYFIERGVQLLAPTGHFSYIVSNKWLRAGYGEPLRRWLKQKRLAQLVDFGSLPVFDKVSAYPCILRLDGGAPKKAFEVATIDTLAFQDLAAKVRSLSFWVDQALLGDGGWALVNRTTRNLLEKLRRTGVPLEQYVQGKIYYGIKTGLNEAFVIDAATRQRLVDEDPRSEEIIKPLLRGQDIKRYSISFADLYLIFTRHGIDVKQHHAVERHLEQYRARLTPRPSGYQGEWAGRKAGPYEWYEIQDIIGYWKEFERPKVVWPNLCPETRFAYDADALYVNAPANILPISPDFAHVVGILNSPVMDWFMRQTAAERGGGFLEYKPVYVKELSIPVGDSAIVATLSAGAARLLAEQASDDNTYTREAAEREVNSAIYELYGLSPREIAIVEGAWNHRSNAASPLAEEL
jgi:hypothetical protein